MLRVTSQLARAGTATHIKNAFYNGLQPPSAVIALNSPTLGDYERRLLSKIFDKFSSNINNSSESTSTSNTKRAKPLFLCADGAYSKIAKLPSLLNAVDMVVGDGDSLLWWKQQEASLQQQQQKQSSVALGGNSSPPAPVSHIVLHHAEHFGDDRHGRSSSSVSQDAVKAVVHEDNVEHFQLLEQSFLRKRALFVRVLDQNTTDFEKCLTVCERVLSSQYWAKATHQHVDDAHHADDDATSSHQKNHVVLVLGFQGGEWHHEMAALHAGAKYSAGSSAYSSPPSILDLRFHAPHTTIAFCNPNGETIFDRNVDFENKTFALIPFGDSPSSLVTTGLKWNLDHHCPRGSPKFSGATSSSDPYFGFTNASVRSSYISTSNRITDPDGRVKIQLSGTDACVVALAIHLDATQPPQVHVSGKEGAKKEATAPRLGVTMLVYRDTDNNTNNNAHQQQTSIITTEYLLVQRGKAPSKGLWGCPGGSVEWGEGSLAAAVRELKEETGLEVDGQSLSLPLGRSPVHTSDVIVPSEEQQANNLANEQEPVRPVEHHFVLMHFAAQLHQEGSLATLKAGDDAAAVAWKSKEEITAMTSEGLCVAGVLDVISAVETARNTAAAAKRSKL
ncbi:Hypothetical protein, putative [Bodo saltans]|uniref:Nudix hydrolase domain-containing protein n=1 Tax=Bodo saltans TaxID=75058 RepID=A0A0S4J3P0_BODSA|nr:Hypothetical protein, putative [Bodo saltans]|eukprot:CUG73042.1 Hypothetical protein, putative [Bodo saltans]